MGGRRVGDRRDCRAQRAGCDRRGRHGSGRARRDCPSASLGSTLGCRGRGDSAGRRYGMDAAAAPGRAHRRCPHTPSGHPSRSLRLCESHVRLGLRSDASRRKPGPKCPGLPGRGRGDCRVSRRGAPSTSRGSGPYPDAVVNAPGPPTGSRAKPRPLQRFRVTVGPREPVASNVPRARGVRYCGNDLAVGREVGPREPASPSFSRASGAGDGTYPRP